MYRAPARTKGTAPCPHIYSGPTGDIQANTDPPLCVGDLIFRSEYPCWSRVGFGQRPMSSEVCQYPVERAQVAHQFAAPPPSGVGLPLDNITAVIATSDRRGCSTVPGAHFRYSQPDWPRPSDR